MSDEQYNSLLQTGIAKAENGDLDDAIADYNRAIEINPDAAAYYNRGNAKAEKGDLDDAIADYSRAIDLNPGAAAYNNRGYVKAKKGDLSGAIADYSRAIELNPDTAAYYNRGNAKAEKGDLDGAIADYSRAIELKPDAAAAYNNRGGVKTKKGDFDGAIADYSRAIELKPDDANAYNNRGNAKAEKGDLSGAIADYSKALDLNPNYAVAQGNLGVTYGIEAEKTQDFQSILEYAGERYEKIAKRWFRGSAAIIAVVLAVIGIQALCLAGVKIWCLCPTSDGSEPFNLQAMTFNIFLITIALLIIRQYTNAKRLYLETENRLIAARLFASIRTDNDTDVKKEAYSLLLSRISGSPYNEKASEDAAVDLAKLINLLKK